jgi:hypothetical protein
MIGRGWVRDAFPFLKGSPTDTICVKVRFVDDTSQEFTHRIRRFALGIDTTEDWQRFKQWLASTGREVERMGKQMRIASG